MAGSGAFVGERSAIWSLITWGMPGIAAVLAVVLGIRLAHNPVDQTAQCLVMAPLTMLIADLWVLGVGFFWRRTLSIVWMPLVLGIGHVLIWFWAKYLIQFEVFYRLEPTGPLSGVYVAESGVVVLLSVLALLVIVSGVFAAWQTVVLSGVEEIPIGVSFPVDDVLLLDDYIFEVQALLTNLGYDVGGINGEVGEETATALKQFQNAFGFVPDGEITMQMLTVLRSRGRADEIPSLAQSVRLFIVHISQSLIGWMRAWWRRKREG
ncbi:MAG: peptidoglycan-binding domain-containing protein [Candidatus Latescibacteria bacterium]|nr:peptidoglycan-binding domain-containing protein [Candidatus Latescibacterota bacterium]